MSRVPSRPELEGDIADLKNRIRALEALMPGQSLEVQSFFGGQDINPCILLDFDDGVGSVGGLQVFDNGNGEADISLPQFEFYTPTLSVISGTDPSGNVQNAGSWIALGGFVNYNGAITFGSSANIGTGIWQIDLPIAFEGLGQPVIGLAALRDQFAVNTFQFIMDEVITDPSHAAFSYLDPPPMGATKWFNDTSGWTLSDGDYIQWNAWYRYA